MSSLWDVAAPLIVAGILGGIGWLIRCARQARQREHDRDAKIDRLVQVFMEGTPPDPFSGSPGQPSIMDQLADLRGLHATVRRTAEAVEQLRVSSVAHGASIAALKRGFVDEHGRHPDTRSAVAGDPTGGDKGWAGL